MNANCEKSQKQTLSKRKRLLAGSSDRKINMFFKGAKYIYIYIKIFICKVFIFLYVYMYKLFIDS